LPELPEPLVLPEPGQAGPALRHPGLRVLLVQPEQSAEQELPGLLVLFCPT